MNELKYLVIIWLSCISPLLHAQWADISIPIYSFIKDVHFSGNNGYAITGFQNLGTSAQVFKTDKHGLQWVECSPNFMEAVIPQGVANWLDYGDDLTITFTGEAIHFFNADEGLISITVLVEIHNDVPSGLSFSRTLKTTNGGNSWYQVQETNGATGFTQFIGLSTPNSVIVHRHGDILRSYDKGENWEQIFDYSYGWDFDFQHIIWANDKLYAGVHQGGFNNYGKTMESVNEGLTWTEVFPSFPVFSYRSDIAISPQGAIMMNTTDNSIFPPESHTYISTDNGSTWMGPSFGLTQIEFGNNQWYAINGANVLASNNGVNWENTPTLPEPVSGLKSYNNHVYLYGQNGAIFTSIDVNTIVGQQNISTDSFLKLQPNILKQGNALSVRINTNKTVKLQIFDLQGKLLLNHQLNALQTLLPIPLAKGLYLVKASNEQQTTSTKLIVQ